MESDAAIVIEKLYFHTNMNSLDSHVDSTSTNDANTNSLKYNVKELIFSIDENVLNKKSFVFI